MPSTINAVDNLTPFFAGHLQTMSPMAPRDALDHWDANKDHMRSVALANLDVDKMQGDHLAACVRQAFDRVWATIPPGRLSGFEDQAKILGLVYRVASQMHAVRELLNLSGAKERGLRDMTTPIVFRNRKPDDLPKPGAAVTDSGRIMGMAMGTGNIRLRGGDIDKEALAKKLRLSPVMRVALDDRSAHFKTAEGFYAGTTVDYAAAKTPATTEVTLGGRTARINKSAAGVDALRVEAFGWGDMEYSVPLAIIHDILRQYGDRAVEIVDAREGLPLKKS